MQDISPLWESMRPYIPTSGEKLQHTPGASTDEPSLNMMREMTDGHAQTHSALCPFWMALMNVYRLAISVNCFFSDLFRHGSSRIRRWDSCIKINIISQLSDAVKAHSPAWFKKFPQPRQLVFVHLQSTGPLRGRRVAAG